MKTLNLHFRKSPRAFTLVETLVSTMIISFVIVGPLMLASNASAYARLTKDTMISTYLAQEALELLHHQQDSVYLRCIQARSSECSSTGNESPRETSWRLFKARLGNNSGGVSCYENENPSGCAYDFIDMTSNIDSNPTKYNVTSTQCPQMAFSSSTGMYLCSGVRGGAGYATTHFRRYVTIQTITTYNKGDPAYQDDLRITATVTFKRPNGFTHTIKVIDFLHARS